jgi:hypothetical protein
LDDTFWAVHCGIKIEVWVVLAYRNEGKCLRLKENRGRLEGAYMVSICNSSEDSTLQNKTLLMEVGRKCTFMQVVGFMKLMAFLD